MNDSRGIGMTSPRTRERLVRRLIDNGITDARVLDQIRQVPRRVADAIQHALVADAVVLETLHQPLARARRRHSDTASPYVRVHPVRPVAIPCSQPETCSSAL